MHSFSYRDGVFCCEDVSLDVLAERHGTPLYVYSGNTIRDHFQRLDEHLAALDHMICYAVKANSTGAILRLLAKEGAGFDIVSGGELYRVLKAGGQANRCTFAGVGKTRDEIAYSLREGIYCFNAESEPELEMINAVAGEMGVKAPVALRINPDVDAGTHKYISTGKSENKFGIGIHRAEEAYALAASLPNLDVRGVQIHIGSQITKPGPFAEAVETMLPLVRDLKSKYGIRHFSIGGGMGIVYSGSVESGAPEWWARAAELHPLTVDAYAGAVVPLLAELGLTILFEPGRFLVGNAGVLLMRTLYVKRTEAKKFVVVDAGMNDLIRPALYEGYHEVAAVNAERRSPMEIADLVGPVCESGDFFAQDREIPAFEQGDLVALMSGGAYGFSMASTYNSRPLPAEVLVEGSESRVVRERGTLEDLVRGEVL